MSYVLTELQELMMWIYIWPNCTPLQSGIIWAAMYAVLLLFQNDASKTK